MRISQGASSRVSGINHHVSITLFILYPSYPSLFNFPEPAMQIFIKLSLHAFALHYLCYAWNYWNEGPILSSILSADNYYDNKFY